MNQSIYVMRWQTTLCFRLHFVKEYYGFAFPLTSKFLMHYDASSSMSVDQSTALSWCDHLVDLT